MVPRARAHGRDAIGTARARTQMRSTTGTRSLIQYLQEAASAAVGGERHARGRYTKVARARQVVAVAVVSVSAVHAMVGGARLGKE